MNALLFERPVWLATGPLVLEEEAQDMEDFTYHRPVLATEAVELLAPRPGSLVVDATVGGGGHTEALLHAGADILGLDQDPDAIEYAREKLAHCGSRVTLRQANFRLADKILEELGISKIGGAILDLGVSSRQLENAERGFSVMRSGPLDMRMDPRTSLTAADIVNRYSEEDLTRLFRDLGEENDELGALEQGLHVLTARLEPTARIAVITFHSLEDRIVKNFFRDRSREWIDKPEWPAARPNPKRDLNLITAKPIEPSENERRINPRARSAKLRVAEKIA